MKANFRIVLLTSVFLGTVMVCLFQMSVFAIAMQAQIEEANRIELTVVDEQQQPVVGADIQLRFWTKESSTPNLRSGKTDDRGSLVLHPGDVEVISVSVTCYANQKVASRYVRGSWDSDWTSPLKHTFVLEEGSGKTGRVVDENGTPIVDASIQMSILAQDVSRPNWNTERFRYGLATTTKDGRFDFKSSCVDTGLEPKWIIDHPDYLGPVTLDLDGINGDVVLPTAATIKGTIRDDKSQPIAGATLHFGDEVWGRRVPVATSDENGSYELKGCWPGSASVTVQADNFAPVAIETTASLESAVTVDFGLKPSAKLNGRVIDRAGKGIAGALVRSQSWNGKNNLRWQTVTGELGDFEWQSVPGDGLKVSVYADGMLNLHGHVLAPGEESIAIHMDPVVELSGQILDAKTGEPIPEVSLQWGDSDQETGDFVYLGSSYFRGKREFNLQVHDLPKTFRLRAVAAGYETQELDPIDRKTGNRVREIKMQPMKGTAADQAWKTIEDKIDEAEFGMEAAVALTNLRDLGAEITYSAVENRVFRVKVIDEFQINSARGGVAVVTQDPTRKKWKGQVADLNQLELLGDVQLTLDGLEINAELLKVLVETDSVTKLDINAVWQLDEEEFAGFAELKSLKALSIDNGWQNFPIQGVEAISSLPDLNEFAFQRGNDNENASAEFAARLSRFSALKVLTLRGDIDGKGAAEIAKMKTLEKLSINSFVDDKFIEQMGMQPQLRNLSLNGPGITDFAFLHITEQFPNLERLTLFRATITERGIDLLAQRPLRKLKIMQVPGCDREAFVDLQRAMPDCLLHMSYRFSSGSSSHAFTEHEIRPSIESKKQ